ncbi:MAG: CRTAC1 family protein [Gemmatimonadota bacterium]|nr:CRTAC1 family protein [Gemmatimonadota bacterium]
MPNCPADFLTALCILAFIPLKIAHAESGDLGPAQLLRPFPEPAEVIEPPWLAHRRQAQLEAAQAYKVFCDFSFTDHLQASGIEFRNRVVGDSGKNYIPVHYDHGNGLAVGDVDGDGLYDLYFTTQVGSNQLWRNRGAARFADYTTPSLELADRIGVSASFGDIDNDGDIDLYATAVRLGNRLLVNDGTGRFADITAHSGTGWQAHSSSGEFFDYNNDGLLDLFLTNVGIYTQDEQWTAAVDPTRLEKGLTYQYHRGFKDAFSGHLKPERAEQSALFKNLGQRVFAEVSREVGLLDSSWSGDASPVDFNGDGWQDLYVLNMQGHDEYYENVAGQHFVKKSREVFPKTPWGSMGIKSLDYDNDGRMDLFISDMHSDMSLPVEPADEKLKAYMQFPEDFLQSEGLSIFGNAFYHHLGEGQFEEISDLIGTENYWPWGLSSGDLNADGWQDVFVASSMNYPHRYGINTVLLNDRGRGFLDSEFVLGVEPRRHGRTAQPWFALDCDEADREHKHCEGQEGSLLVYAALGTRSSALFDVEGDGDLDIVTNEFNGVPQVLLSDLSQRSARLSYVEVALTGKSSNRDGLGAVVAVEAGDQVYTQVQDGQSGYLSQSACGLYFGLGEAAMVDRLTVRWPSGQVQTLDGPIQTNQRLTLEEP